MLGGPDDEEEDDQVYYKTKLMIQNDEEVNQLVTSDDMYISDSYGYNASVDSLAVEQFDYVEDVEPVDE